MTLPEFQAWFSGYTEDMKGRPTEKQWKRIKKIVKDVDGSGITERIFLDRHWHSPPYWSSPYLSIGTGTVLCDSNVSHTVSNTDDWSSTDTVNLMYEAGKAEYTV